MSAGRPPLRAAVEAMSRDLEVVVGRITRLERAIAAVWTLANLHPPPAAEARLEARAARLFGEVVELAGAHDLDAEEAP